VICLYATISPGQEYPRKPRVAEVFEDKDKMDDRIRGLKKRKRAEGQADQRISASSGQALSDQFDTSYGTVEMRRTIFSVGCRVRIGLWSGKTHCFFASLQST
jgi:hypothetical protein